MLLPLVIPSLAPSTTTLWLSQGAGVNFDGAFTDSYGQVTLNNFYLLWLVSSHCSNKGKISNPHPPPLPRRQTVVP